MFECVLVDILVLINALVLSKFEEFLASSGECAKTLMSTNPQDAGEGLNHDLWGCLFS